MPDHFHWLLDLGDEKTLSQTVQFIKSITSKRLKEPIWQRGFHDRAIRHENNLKDVARYIVANPIRAGLVSNIRQYPHWDSIWI